MGFLDKLLKRREQDFLTDDEREIRDYEENEYRAESGVADSCHAEFIITSAAPTPDGNTTVRGSVTEGTFKQGDAIKITQKNNNDIVAVIQAMTVSTRLSHTATEGQTAEFLLDTPYTKLIKRNDIIKKIIKES